MSSATALVSHSDCGRHDTGWGHPEHVGRLRAVLRAVGQDVELFHALEHVEGRRATRDELELVHDPDYIREIHALCAAGGGHFDSDTPISPGSWDASTAAVGCVLDAVERALAGTARRSFCALRPPGHHALPARAMGFCLFGNAGIAAHHALQSGQCERVLIVDWDVHHGNGTQALVESNERIHFVSMHQWPWYPGTGAQDERGVGNLWNVPMAPGQDASTYLRALLAAVDEACRSFTPDLVLVSSGFDSMLGDPLGGFTLLAEDVYTLTTELVDRAESWCSGRLVSTMEGGYNTDTIGEAARLHLRALAGLAAEPPAS